jgi:hypothetical protein
MKEPLRRPRFLYLEDDPWDQDLLRRALVKAHLECDLEFVASEQEFKTGLAKGPPDLIISDFTLPGYDGLSALHLAHSVYPETPFLFVSGTIGEERAVASLKSGATDYILKNHLDRVAPAIQRALAESEDRRQRKRAEQSLIESDAKFRQVAANIDQVFWLLDTSKSEILYVSPAYEKIWGRPSAELNAQPDRWMEAVHPADRARISGARLNQLKGDYDEIYRILRPDGSTRWVRERAYPIRNQAGELYRMVGTAEDVTERHKLQEQLLQAQKMEAVGQLAAGVAHDFNNVLCVIRGYADLGLTEPGGLNPTIADCLNQIIVASERAAAVINQLLTFGRKRDLESCPLQVNEVVENVSKMLSLMIGPEVQLNCRLNHEIPLVLANAAMLEQVLTNLAINGRDAMPAGGEIVFQTSRMDFDEAACRLHPGAQPGQYVCLSVADSGTGIAPEIVPRIFEPFFTTKEVGKGSGLGLAIVYNIVKQHQGWIEVSSRPNQGTMFTVYIPALLAPFEACEAPADSSALRGGSETVLLVEDEPAMRLLTRRALEAYGYRVWEASSGPAALQIWETERAAVDLLLADIRMPGGISGRDLADQLRAEKAELKVILVSGYDPQPEDVGSHPHQAAVLLKKPYPLSTLLKLVRRRLDDGSQA